MNSINKNGISVCPAGEEHYTTFVAGAFRGTIYYQYDYKTPDGRLFSTVAPTLEKCREKRDQWLTSKA